MRMACNAGLAGMRERAESIGAQLRFQCGAQGGAALSLTTPVSVQALG